jgi:CRISPR-associated protein Cas1
LNFLAQKNVTAHVFNYYWYYAGSYYTREYLNSGYLLVQQVVNYQSKKKRLVIARELIQAAAHGIQRNVAYYQNRDKQVTRWSEEIARQAAAIEAATEPAELRGIEGRIRHQYYEAFNVIVGNDFPFEKRVKRPPDNPVNAMISFGIRCVMPSV